MSPKGASIIRYEYFDSIFLLLLGFSRWRLWISIAWTTRNKANKIYRNGTAWNGGMNVLFIAWFLFHRILNYYIDSFLIIILISVKTVSILFFLTGVVSKPVSRRIHISTQDLYLWILFEIHEIQLPIEKTRSKMCLESSSWRWDIQKRTFISIWNLWKGKITRR